MKQLALGFQYNAIVYERKRCAVRTFIHAISQRLGGHVQVGGIFLHRMHRAVMMFQRLAEADEGAVGGIVDTQW